MNMIKVSLACLTLLMCVELGLTKDFKLKTASYYDYVDDSESESLNYDDYDDYPTEDLPVPISYDYGYGGNYYMEWYADRYGYYSYSSGYFYDEYFGAYIEGKPCFNRWCDDGAKLIQVTLASAALILNML